MTVEITLKNGDVHEWKYNSTWDMLMWSLDFYGGLRGTNAFIAREVIATMRVKGK